METVFRNEENGYSVLQIRSGKEFTTVVGVLPEIMSGETVSFTGRWTEHESYGPQFSAQSCAIETPTTLLGIERYLASGLISGVGPSTASRIVQAFGSQALDIIETHPERLLEVPGIGEKKCAQICESYQKQMGARKSMVFLQQYGISPALSVKIARRYGGETEALLRQNPYRMIDDIEGVGFLTADRIALQMGIYVGSEFRIQYGIRYVLQDASVQEGHTFLPKETLIRRSCAALRANEDLVGNMLDKLVLDGEILLRDVEGITAAVSKHFFRTEQEIAIRLRAHTGSVQRQDPSLIQHGIRLFEQGSGLAFSATQKDAIEKALTNDLLIITGGPGTGKTTIINCILRLMGHEEDTLLAAPTGRAAKRMSEATGHEARTIHRMLAFGGDSDTFQHDEDNPLECRCIIVDELSMVDVFLMSSLLRAIPLGARIILVGDADQLPSVGPGNVLKDMLDSGSIPHVRLTEIFRQNENSVIVQNAHRINRGMMPILNQKDSDFFFERKHTLQDAANSVVALCSTRLPAFLKTSDSSGSIQVLSPTRKGPCGVYELNRRLQAALNPPSPQKGELRIGDMLFRRGDKIIHTKNNYELEWKNGDGLEGKGVFNGDIGYIEGVSEEQNMLSVRFEDGRLCWYEDKLLEDIELAYCLSVHKSQGSEFPAIVMPVVPGPPMLQTRNLFYTALTRARQLVVLVGTEACIEKMVNNNYINKRYTLLCHAIRQVEEFGL